jgi:hypothetical protein
MSKPDSLLKDISKANAGDLVGSPLVTEARVRINQQDAFSISLSVDPISGDTFVILCGVPESLRRAITAGLPIEDLGEEVSGINYSAMERLRQTRQ